MTTVLSVPGIQKLGGIELRALADAAKQIGVPVDWLATIVSFETGGSFSPAQPNRTGSNAFGLIQFLPVTAANLLGGTREEAAARGKAMGFAEQLQEMVVPYFQSFRTQFDSLQDLYLAVFYPAAMGKSPSHVIGAAPSNTYVQNAGLDRDGKGYITKNDVTAAITRHYEKAGGRVGIPASWALLTIGAVLSVIGLYLVQPHLPPEARLPEEVLRPVRKAIAMAKKKASGLATLVPLALVGVIGFALLLAKGKL